MKATDFISKPDVRQIIKANRVQTKRISHPHAHYNQLGRISCLICGVQIKSEPAWHAHVLSKTHKQNEMNAESRASLKRPVGTEKQLPAHSSFKTPKLIESGRSSNTEVVGKKVDPEKVSKPTDKNPAEKCREELNDSKLPEGFFDDKYKDAKVRNVPYKDKMTEEVELFTKQLMALERESEDIVEKESEAMVSGRELEEIDTQLHKWEHLNELQSRAESLKSKVKSFKPSLRPTSPTSRIKQEPDQSVSSSDEENDEEFDLYNFRTKSSV